MPDTTHRSPAEELWTAAARIGEVVEDADLAGPLSKLMDLYAEMFTAGVITNPGWIHVLAVARAVNAKVEATR